MTAARRFAVLQLGARMNYAVPALLAASGMLDTLYTDIHAGNWPARLLTLLPPAMRPKPVRRLLGRRIPGEIARCAVHSVPMRALAATLAGNTGDPGIARCVVESDFGRANAFYAFSHGHSEIIRTASRRGLFTVFEQVIGPTHNEILREERERFPGIERQSSRADESYYLDAHRSIWQSVGCVLSPSDFVTAGIAALGGPQHKVRLVPYGIPASLLCAVPQPVPGRVLFVGQVGLRKGSHYLAAAARLLRERNVPCEVRAIGEVPPAIERDVRFKGPVYIGQIPRTEVLREFLAADIFVLPSLAEGSATAHLEALACGLPVIATPNAGTVVRDGRDGKIVPIRDPRTLADAIEAIVTNRPLRAWLSANARERASNYTWDRYRDRLLEALKP